MHPSASGVVMLGKKPFILRARECFACFCELKTFIARLMVYFQMCGVCVLKCMIQGAFNTHNVCINAS